MYFCSSDTGDFGHYRNASIDLKDISFTQVLSRENILYLILAGIVFVVGLITLAFDTKGGFITCLIAAIGLVIAYFVTKTPFFRVYFSGGFFDFWAEKTSKQDVAEFQKQLRIWKDAVTGYRSVYEIAAEAQAHTAYQQSGEYQG